MASGYLLLWNKMDKLVWAKVWTLGLTPKINIFFWLMIQDKILSLDKLTKKDNISQIGAFYARKI